MKRLAIRLFGGMTLKLDEKTITRLGTQKTRALLAYLVMHAGQMLSREQMAALLWGDSPEERARHSLRQALHTLRQVVAPYLVVEPDSVAFNAESNYWLDVKEFSRLIGQATTEHLIAATDLSRDEFLA